MNRRFVAGGVGVLLMCATVFLRGAGSQVADAVMRGDTAAVRTLLQQKADVNAPQVDGATALHWAVYRNDLETTDLLIRAGANVKAASREGATPLAMASLYGKTAMIEKLLKAGADAKQRGPTGETTVMLAARSGNAEAIKVLVAAGADVNAKENVRATTALMWAAEQRHPVAVKALVELGADVSARTGPAGLPRNYFTNGVDVVAVQAAHERRQRATAAGRTYDEQLAFDQANGLVATGRGRTGGQAANSGTPAAALPFGTKATRDDDADTQNDAQDNNVDVVIAGLVGGGGGGLTPLVFAAREGDVESAQVLVDAGADMNQVTQDGWTPLLVATNNRNYKLGAMLLEHGANPNISSKGGFTPLYLATDNRNIEGGDYPVPKPDTDDLAYITRLLDHGADVNARVNSNTLSRTIFTMQWFHETGATPFVRAAQSSDLALMKLFLARGADPKVVTEHGDTALTAASGMGWLDGVTFERSPKENLEAVRLLLDLGLDVNAANADGRTPLMAAANKGRIGLVQLLVDHGAKLETRDRGSQDSKDTGPLAGHFWNALDYADGLVRTGTQSAIARPEAAAFIRKLMAERGLFVPPPNRSTETICLLEQC